ncbi:uncharacterized protein [Rhodnius prolixus]|uniref:uncharacterized protein n=1 Tax=Rhodnius prolixus TaxID=13249 RepID=UPI003D18A3C2
MPPRRDPLDGTLKVTAVAPENDRHKNDVVTLLFHEDKLISGADDGQIKIWTPDLQLIAQIDAHPVNVYSVAVVGDSLYSCSNDGTVKIWNMGTWDFKATLLENQESEVIKVYADSGRLYAGNDKGEIFVFENDVLLAQYYLNEDIMDFLVIGPLVFNARNADVSVTEMMPGPRFSYMSRGAMIGRFPVRMVGEKVCFLSRCARWVYVHANNKEEKFKRIVEIKAHDMTITSIAQLPGREHIMITGGYDRVIKAWDINTKKNIGKIDIGVCISEIHPGLHNQFYVSSSDGFLVRLDANIP